jgi:hypothetical protein
MSDDAVREFIDHLMKLPQRPVQKLDLFIVSNGGDGVVPWRLIPILREYTSFVSVLIPFRAYSAATIMALGANEIVMHKFGAMGPIDPTVTNEFNPIENGTNRRLGISVEDVKAYVSFIKETVGIRHEEELASVVKILAEKIHPLALGNVERFILQSRMIARKLLELHTDSKEHHLLETVIEALASKLYFHGHPINRVEARQLGLKVLENVSDELETAMWDLYVDFEDQLEFRVPYDPIGKLQAGAVTPPSLIPGQIAEISRSEEDLTFCMVESARLSSSLIGKTRHILSADGMGQNTLAVIGLGQKWDQIGAP